MDKLLENLNERWNNREANLPRKLVFRYGFALLVSFAALLIKPLFPDMGRAPFLIPFAAVALSAVIGGLGPGIFSTVFLGIAIDFLVTSSGFDFKYFHTYQFIFISEGLLLSLIFRAREHAKDLSNRKTQELAATLSNIGEGVIRSDCQGKIVFMNHIAEKLTGWKKEEATGTKLGKVLKIYNRRNEKILLKFDEKLKTKRLSINREGVILYSKTNEQIPIDLNISMLAEKNRQVHGVVIVIHDNTERFNNQLALEEKEKKFQAMADHAPNLFWMLNEKSEPVYFNKSWLKFTGKTLEKLLKQNPIEDVHPQDQERVNYVYQASFEKRKEFAIEFRMKKKNGKYRWVLTSGAPYFEGKTLKGYMGAAIDITDRKENEEKNVKLIEEIQEGRKKIKNIIGNIPGIVWEAEANQDEGVKRITFISKYAETMLGYATESWAKENFLFDVIHTDDRQKAKEDFISLIKKREKGTFQFRMITKNKGVIWVETQVAVVCDKDQKPIAIRGVSTDTTQQMEFEKKKDEFISIASHELKTPVTSVKLFIQHLAKKARIEKEEDYLKYLLKIDGQINNMTDLINDLLDISRIEAGKLQFYQEYFILDDLISETVEALQSEKNQIQVEGETKQKIYADKQRVAQVLINLLTNAIKYSPHSKKIYVKASKIDGKVTVSVQDFGIGISKKNQQKIFDRFYREDGNRERTYPGLGIGLYIASEIVKRHNGTIGVESVKGKGSTFFFTLPIADRKQAERGELYA